MAAATHSSGVGQFIRQFGQNLWAELQTVLSVIGNFLQGFVEVWSVSIDDFQSIVDDYNEIKQNLKTEIQKIKDFSLQPHLKTRVINVPIAVDQIHALVDDVRQGLTDVTDGIIQPIHDLILVFRSESSTFTDQDRPAAAAKALSFLHSVETAIHQIRIAMDSAKDLTDLANQITDGLNGLDAVFLQQKNPRHRVALKAGGSVLERVGKLHH